MKKLMLVLGCWGMTSAAGWAGGFSENFETYDSDQPIIERNGWAELGRGEWFEANATVSGDPSFLGTRYGSLSNNGRGQELSMAWVNHTFDKFSSGILAVGFDVLFQAGGTGGLESCSIYLSDGDKVPGITNTNLIAAAVTVGVNGLRVHDGGWQVVDSFALENNAWYHFILTVDLTQQTWGMTAAKYTGDVLGSPVTASFAGDSDFAYRDAAVDDVGLIEFCNAFNVTNDSLHRGFLIDNLNVPEPGVTCLLPAGVAFLKRRRRGNQ
jgi:hypothetical protein